jgi:Protein of unknown function (DUF1822)
MNYTMNYSDLASLKLSIPIGTTAHHAAYEISKFQPDDDKAIKIYANVLAVHAVHAYLQCLKIDSSLEESESYHPVVALFLDMADLILLGLGSLECRLIDQQAQRVTLPANVVGVANRIGCVVLRMEGDFEDIEDLTELEIVGFTPNLASEIAVSSLVSIDELLDRLQELKAQSADRIAPQSALAHEISTLLESIEPAVRPLLEQIQEVLPQLSVGAIALKFSGLLQAVDRPEEDFMDWLQRILKGETLEPWQYAQGFQSRAIEQSPQANNEPNEEAMKQKSLQLRKLSYKLLKAWK